MSKQDDFIIGPDGRPVYGIDGICDTVADAARCVAREYHANRMAAGVSPIEALFEVALCGGIYIASSLRPSRPFTTVVDKVEPDAVPRPGEIVVVRQCRALDWPVDFLIIVADREGRKCKAVVECDGHEFHERTKDQAERDRSRDRRLQDAGMRVFRFTGAELHRNATMRALEVVFWAERTWGTPT